MADVCDLIAADRNRDMRPFTSWAARNDSHILETTADHRGGLWKYLLCEPLNPRPRHWISPCYYTCKQWASQQEPLHTGDQPRSVSWSPSFFIFPFSCSYFCSCWFYPSAFYIRTLSREDWRAQTFCVWVESLLQGSLTPKGVSKVPDPFFPAFILGLPKTDL